MLAMQDRASCVWSDEPSSTTTISKGTPFEYLITEDRHSSVNFKLLKTGMMIETSGWVTVGNTNDRARSESSLSPMEIMLCAFGNSISNRDRRSAEPSCVSVV